MKKKILYLISICFLMFSCEKDNITNDYIDDNPDRVYVKGADLKKALVSSPDGWVMMVKSSYSAEVYTPVVMKFDTVNNRVDIRTVYGETEDVESFFRVAIGTGAPQLIFTTGSIISSLYRVGITASDITDYIFNVIKVTNDEIQIQPYRSGNVYAKEGGVIYKLFKRPAEWKWVEEDKYFDFTDPTFRTNVIGATSSMKIEYLNAPDRDITFNSIFNDVAANLLTNMRRGFAFALSRNIGTGGFKPTDHIIFRAPYLDVNYNLAPIVANNTISFFPGLGGYTSNVSWLRNFVNSYNFHYLICKSVVRVDDNVKMEFEAYDKEGKVIIKAFYDNLR